MANAQPMKFRFYITNLYDGTIEGTNDEKRATDLAECEDFFVVEPTRNLWWQSGIKVPVEEAK